MGDDKGPEKMDGGGVEQADGGEVVSLDDFKNAKKHPGQWKTLLQSLHTTLDSRGDKLEEQMEDQFAGIVVESVTASAYNYKLATGEVIEHVLGIPFDANGVDLKSTQKQVKNLKERALGRQDDIGMTLGFFTDASTVKKRLKYFVSALEKVEDYLESLIDLGGTEKDRLAKLKEGDELKESTNREKEVLEGREVLKKALTVVLKNMPKRKNVVASAGDEEKEEEVGGKLLSFGKSESAEKGDEGKEAVADESAPEKKAVNG